uniref:Uncharacterized protein n=1 Tax=Arundo donax TaxID=35708 RepID=A0A0A9G5B1_ARUDO
MHFGGREMFLVALINYACVMLHLEYLLRTSWQILLVLIVVIFA